MISPSAILQARILIVDDIAANVTLLEFMLADAGYTNVSSTMDARTVLELHRVNRYDIILLDLNLPHLSGFDILDGLKLIEADGYLSVLAVTADPGHKQRALESGARDFVSKPFDHLEVLMRIRNMIEVRLLYVETRAYGLRMARYDSLTGLPNRLLFNESLAQEVLRAPSDGFALLAIGLDGFKRINETLGYLAGDNMLDQCARRLAECLPMHCTIGRLGGDEFALILASAANANDAALAAERIRRAMHASFALLGQPISITASIGVALYPADAAKADMLLRYADTAMHQAKQAGRDTYRFFTGQMNLQAVARLELETAMRQAIEQQQFSLHYQPKVSISTGCVVGAEALLRWNRPGHGMVSPAAFIPLLEETGLIVAVGAWVIETACRQIAEWQRTLMMPVHVAVNVSGRQFAQGELEMVVLDALSASAIDPGLLQLEITESALMDNAQRAVEVMGKLKASGVGIAIDDFGTGYSSLAYLKHFPADALKIDIAFIRDVTSNPDDAAIVQAIIGMAHSLKLEVVAEGVETAAQLAHLARGRCDQIQGYFFSKPLTAQDFGQMLREKRRMPVPGDDVARPQWTLMVVDDEANVLSALKRLLNRDGYRILTAQSAAEGFELLALNPVHVILCDQRMPEMNGTEFLDRVKDLYPDTSRIVLSGYTDIDAILGAINRGSLYRFFTKPWDNDALRENIRAAFRHYWQIHGLVPGEIEAALKRKANDDDSGAGQPG
jgi:diguanylate cyclase (GGDEF)-like protein